MTPRTRRKAPTAGTVTAEELGRTPLGARALPALMRRRAVAPPASAEGTTDAGLRVVAVRKPGTPLVEVRLRIPFGTRSRSAAVHAARAEVLAETLALGTAELDRGRVDEVLAGVGGSLRVSVDPHRLSLGGSVLATGLPVLTGVLARLLTGAAYRAGDVTGERDRLVEHLTIAASEPSVIARQALLHRLFGDHPAAHEMPDPESVAAVTPAAVRALHRRAVVPAGSTLVLVGDLRPAAAVEQTCAALAGWTAPGTARPLTTPPALPAGDVLALHRPGAVQSQIRLAAPAPDRTDPDHAAFQLANLVLGGYFSSRLVENIREDKGYTYSAGSGTEFWPGRPVLGVVFDTTTPSTAPALLETRYELGRLALLPPTEAEVESARNYAIGTLALSLSTQAGYASTLSRLIGVGLDGAWLREHPARLAAVTRDEVAAAAARWLAPSAFTGVVAGDLDVVGDALQRLGGVTTEASGPAA